MLVNSPNEATVDSVTGSEFQRRELPHEKKRSPNLTVFDGVGRTNGFDSWIADEVVQYSSPACAQTD